MTGQGMKAKKACRKIRDYLLARAPFLAPTRSALLMAFKRKLAAYRDEGAAGLRDGREDNAGNNGGFEFPEADRDLLIHRAVFQNRGDIARAWRELKASGEFSPATLTHYANGCQRKSYVPGRILESVGPEVEMLTVMHQGPRAFDQIKGYVSRSYDGIAALKCFSADDFTMPVYFYAPDGAGWFKVTRGQTLIYIDFASSRVLFYSLQPDRNYSSLVIRSGCTHLFSAFGVPQCLLFERGIWQSASLITGSKPAALSFAEVTQGLREFGIRFIHAIRARSKTVERIGGMLQDLMEGEPGYCGRDERRDAPESLRKQIAQVEARNAHPSKWFFSYEQWNRRLGEIVEHFNAEPQQGRICQGMSPEQTFEAKMNPNDPPMQLSAGLRYLLAHDKRRAQVTLNGVTIQIGKQKFNYRGQETAHLVGREVLAWFDPENPESWLSLIWSGATRSVWPDRRKSASWSASLIQTRAGLGVSWPASRTRRLLKASSTS